MQTSKDKHFRYYDLPTGMSIEQMEHHWKHGMDYGSTGKESSVPFKQELFRTPPEFITRLREMSRKGKEDSDRMALEEAGMRKIVWGDPERMLEEGDQREPGRTEDLHSISATEESVESLGSDSNIPVSSKREPSGVVRDSVQDVIAQMTASISPEAVLKLQAWRAEVAASKPKPNRSTSPQSKTRNQHKPSLAARLRSARCGTPSPPVFSTFPTPDIDKRKVKPSPHEERLASWRDTPHQTPFTERKAQADAQKTQKIPSESTPATPSTSDDPKDDVKDGVNR